MLKTLSQLTCVITLPYYVATESSFVVIEFICYLHSFMLQQSNDCHDKVPLSFALINVVIGVKSVVIEKFFVTTRSLN